MKVQFILNQLDKTVSVYLEERFFRCLPKGSIRQSFEKEMQQEELEAYLDGLEKKLAEAYLARILAQKGYLSWQLMQKLQKRGFSEKTSRAVVEKGLRLGWLDDQQFLQNTIFKEKGKGYGRRAVFFKLRQLNFKEGEIQKALELFYPREEEKQNLALFKQKKGAKNPAFWLRRGFSCVFDR
ncbi:MAG: RecX family transcriptional regulator [Parachlamydiales bacterium]|jgi:SOS response regulatory protein OraA/RecX